MYNFCMRARRHKAIQAILRTSAVATQAELAAKLRLRGLEVDQSTLSRDLAELGVRKRQGRYVLPERLPPTTTTDYRAAVLSFLPCGPHLIVIHTAIGQAQPVALAIDAAADPAILATLAGDDTIFVACKNRKTQGVALRRLETWFGDKRGR